MAQAKPHGHVKDDSTLREVWTDTPELWRLIVGDEMNVGLVDVWVRKLASQSGSPLLISQPLICGRQHFCV